MGFGAGNQGTVVVEEFGLTVSRRALIKMTATYNIYIYIYIHTYIYIYIYTHIINIYIYTYTYAHALPWGS